MEKGKKVVTFVLLLIGVVLNLVLEVLGVNQLLVEIISFLIWGVILIFIFASLKPIDYMDMFDLFFGICLGVGVAVLSLVLSNPNQIHYRTLIIWFFLGVSFEIVSFCFSEVNQGHPDSFIIIAGMGVSLTFLAIILIILGINVSFSAFPLALIVGRGVARLLLFILLERR